MSPQEYSKRFKDRWHDAYELKSDYCGSTKPIAVSCCTCGNEYSKTASEALRYGCVHCSRKRNMDKGRKTQSDPIRLAKAFVKRLEEKFGSKYALVGDYVDARTSVKLLCNECGRDFSVRPDDLLYGLRGCDCEFWKRKEEAKQRAVERRARLKPEPVWTEEKFLQRVAAIWGDEFEVLSSFVGISKHVTVRHCLCGSVHEKYAGSLIRNHGCQYCARNSLSAGVLLISGILDEMDIQYEREVRIDGCRHKRLLPFDFAIYHHDGVLAFLIEYDGEQHFRATDRMGGVQKLALIKKRDSIKDSYCDLVKIPLLRINYRSVLGKAEEAKANVKQQIDEFIIKSGSWDAFFDKRVRVSPK